MYNLYLWGDMPIMDLFFCQEDKETYDEVHGEIL